MKGPRPALLLADVARERVTDLGAAHGKAEVGHALEGYFKKEPVVGK